VADSRIRTVSACVWALGKALAYAIATAVVALLLATLLSGADAERFATTAYVATIVAALVLAIKWFLRAASPNAPERAPGPIFPVIFTFAAGVAAFLLLGAALVSQPGNEVLAAAACLGLIAIAALVRGGAVVALNAKLARGDRLFAATRYAAAAAAAALAASALFSSQGAAGFAKLAYVAAVVATLALAASLIAPTRAGAFIERTYLAGSELLKDPAGSWVFARTAEYAVATAVAGLILSGLLPPPYAERFAATAYLATLFAALGIGMSWRLRAFAAEQGTWHGRTLNEYLQFAAFVGALLAIGSALQFSFAAEAAAICACLYLISSSIVKRAA
jgi:hypothetical protein